MNFAKFICVSLLFLTYSANSFSSEPNDHDITYGGLEFERSCAICHGFNGKGQGVMADSLTKQPADLTVITKNNNGHFPFTEIYRIIEGSPKVGIHGSRDMPVWGDRYRKQAKEFEEAEGYEVVDEYLYTRGLILELMLYIMSLQEE